MKSEMVTWGVIPNFLIWRYAPYPDDNVDMENGNGDIMRYTQFLFLEVCPIS